ncbi:HDOD domain-containing protein [Corallincola spongiicola]|uniref:HDOD domain-containing protein n=1 Tax=Corallincola spongiicola TaxID=2520508 RepID=A0ABY1WS60_9GAMM|nr:HDOD domain-containing protein [Corallincola spongiicola]TAA47580.1 HDOD domain-containing protein [Corallincola spongiicola]
MSAEEALFHILEAQLENDELVLPSLPEVAIQVRDAVDDPDSTLAQIVDVVSKDPALSLRLIRIANTAHYARAANVSTLNAALHRIGMRAIKNIAIAMALEQLFVCKNDIVRIYIERAWHQAVDVAAASTAVFANYREEHRSSTVSADTLTLMGLIHNIGVLPILAEAQRHDDVFANPTFLDRAIARFGARIGGAIMKKWGFGEEFAQLVRDWRDMSVQPTAISYLDFVRVGAIYAKVSKDEKLVENILQLTAEKGIFQEGESPFEHEMFMTRFREIKTAFE